MKQYDEEIESIQLKRLLILEDVLSSEIEYFKQRDTNNKQFDEFLREQYETILTQSEKCSYNPLINPQIQIVKNIFDKYQKLYQ